MNIRSSARRDHDGATGSLARSSGDSNPSAPTADRGSSVVADTLSDVLRAVRLTGAVFFDVAAGAPWVASAPPAREIARLVMPDAEHVIEFHAVLEGACWGGLLDRARVRVEAGDVIIFPQGDAHVLSSAPDLRAEPSREKYGIREPTGRPFSLHTGSDLRDVHLVCGFLGCDARPFNPLLSTLPRLLHVRSGGGPNTLLQLFATLALEESSKRRVGRDCVLGKLSELMFVEAVRAHVESLAPEERGWLAGLHDEFVGRALSLLHARPGHSWTLEELGRGAGLSRSALAERFTQYIGQPPMQYLAQWRMQLAAGMLRNGTASVATIADEMGYASEAAFSRAFKKFVGAPPATWRREGAKGANS